MIREIFLSLTNKASKEAKQFGHLYEAIAIGEREKRCEKFWQSHRNESKKLILKIANEIQNKNSLLILGSGPLHEIPIVELSQLFSSITLVDIVHLKETKNKYKELKNLIFIEHDITELETSIAETKSMKNKVPTAFLDQNFDLVISANLLSQLAYHLRNYLEKNSQIEFSDEQLNQFSNQISTDHYSYLQKFNCRTLLITDIETYFLDQTGKLIDTQAPYLQIPFPDPIVTWIWDVAPIPEFSPEISLQMKVAGFILNK